MSISDYIHTYLSYVSHPYNSSGGITLLDLPPLCSLVERFLSLPEHQQLANQISTAIEDHQNLPFRDSVRRVAALRNLVATVEPFIKAVGRFRYAGNSNQLTKLEQQKFRFLLEQGLVLPKMHWDENYTNKKHCSQYWAQQDCLTAVAYRVYLLRNEFSHEAPNYPPEQISILFNTTLAFLILTVRYQPNRAALEFASSPYRAHLEWIAQNLEPDYKRYVPLQASLKWKPTSIEIEDYIVSPMQADPFSLDTLPTGPEEVSTLVKQAKKIVLTGGGGAGKSRTLKHVATLFAKEILSLQIAPQQIPIYLPADALGYGNKLSVCLSRFLKNVQQTEIQTSLANGQYWLFIDGLNEVAPQYYREVVQDIKFFLFSYPKCGAVISTRQETYHNELPLPTYELQPLAPYWIWQILRLNANTEDEGNQLFSRIKNDKRLLALFKTPLMSRLLCKLPTQIRIPRSIGEMMSVLFNQIFDREERKGDQVPRRIKTMVLVNTARTIRQQSGIVLSEEQFLHGFENVTQRFAREVSPTSLLTRLVESGILERRSDSFIGFFHETALDYFSALGLKDTWERSPDEKVRVDVLASTPTSIEILSGLLGSADTLTQFIAQQDLELATRCYSARSQRSKPLFLEFLKDAKSRLLTDSIPEKCVAVRAMAALDEIEATQTVFRVLSKLPEEARVAASNALVQYAPNGITEEVRRYLVSGEFAQQLVAIQFASAHQLVEVTSLLITLAESRQPNLAHDIAIALGHLESPEALHYLEQQCRTPPETRSIPLNVAIDALISEQAVPLLKLALNDSETEVRRSAISRIEATNTSGLDAEVAEVVASDPDFLVRLVGSQILLHRMNEPRREEVIRCLFSVSPPTDESVSAQRIMGVLSLLRRDELGDVVLQALCNSHCAIQSLIVNRVLARDPGLALNLFDLVDFEDPEVPSGVKAALIKAIIRTGDVTLEMLQKAMALSMPIFVRKTVVEMLANLPSDIRNTVLQKALADPAEQVKLEIAKCLSSSPDLCSEQIVTQLLVTPSKSVQRQVWRSLEQHSLFESTTLLNWTEENWSTYVRTRAIEELCKRRFIWPLQRACSLAHDNDPAVRRKGYRILEAISRSSSEHIGQIKSWVVERGYGFLMQLDTKEKLFFHISELIDKQYTPSQDDFVAFKVGESNRGQMKPCAIQIRFLQ